MSEVLSTVIKSCCAKFGQTDNFFNINFGAKMLKLGKEFEILGEMLTFFHIVCTANESNYL